MLRAAGSKGRSSRAGHGIFTAVYKVAQRTAIGTGGGEGRGGLSLRRQAAVGVDGYALIVGCQHRAGGLDAHKVGARGQVDDFGTAATRPSGSAGLLILHQVGYIFELAVIVAAARAANSGHAGRRGRLGDRDGLHIRIQLRIAVGSRLLDLNAVGRGDIGDRHIVAGDVNPSSAVHAVLQAAVHTAQRTAIGTGGSKGHGGRVLLGLCRCTNQRDSSICRGRTGDLNLRKVNASYIHAVDRCNRIADWEIVVGTRCVDHFGHGAGQAGLAGGARGESHARSCRDVHAIGRRRRTGSVDGYTLIVGRQRRAGGLDAHKVGAGGQVDDFGTAATRPSGSAGLLILHRVRHILELAVVTGSSAVNSGHASRRGRLGDRDGLCGGIRRGGAVALLHNIDGTGGQTSKGNISVRYNIRPRAAVDLILQAAVHTAQRTAIGTGGGEGRGGLSLLRCGKCGDGIGLRFGRQLRAVSLNTDMVSARS